MTLNGLSFEDFEDFIKPFNSESDQERCLRLVEERKRQKLHKSFFEDWKNLQQITTTTSSDYFGERFRRVLPPQPRVIDYPDAHTFSTVTIDRINDERNRRRQAISALQPPRAGVPTLRRT